MIDRDKMIERIARIICENGTVDCFCPDPQRVACTSYNKARDILNELIPEGAVVFTKEDCDSKVILDEDHFKRVLDIERERGRKEKDAEILNKIANIDDCGLLKYAHKIIDAIIPEGAVVLTKEEYEDAQVRMAYLQEELGKLLKGDNVPVSAREYGQLLYANENARKEMREIYDKLLGYFPIDKQFATFSRYMLDDVFKEIGVEV